MDSKYILMKYMLFFPICLVLLSCGNGHDDNYYGKEQNKNRIKDTLPFLPNDWKISNRPVFGASGTYKWFNFNKTDSLIFLSKEVRVENNCIIREENLFLGKSKYTTADGSFREELYVSKDYDKNFELTFYYTGPKNFPSSYIKKDSAIRILKRWNLFRYFAF